MSCPRCLKNESLCVCELIKPIFNKINVLILQHPQEPDKDLGSARLANLCLSNSTLKIGLSWPNLSKVLGRASQPSRWAVMYLGSGIKSTEKIPPGLYFVNKKGELLQEKPDHPTDPVEGIVVLDGTWSQAKTLWWRNPWLLKLRRAIIVPSRPSLYRNLRREPRRECLSTIETVAEALALLGEDGQTAANLKLVFEKLLKKVKHPEAPAFRPLGASPRHA
ncbi:MAG: tRNA-uridine aminocarboxypropyltransferase [Bdellovibrionota bacterium]